MDEETLYAEMLEIPVNTCNITYKEDKKRRKKSRKAESDVKKLVFDKINRTDDLTPIADGETDLNAPSPESSSTALNGDDNELTGSVIETFKGQKIKRGKKIADNQTDLTAVTYGEENDVAIPDAENYEEENTVGSENKEADASVVIKETHAKKPFNIIPVQVAVICILFAVIVISNVYMDNSGIAVFLNGVFGQNTEYTDARSFDDFEAVLPTSGNITLNSGVMTFSAKGSVFTPCDGVITALSEDGGKYTVEITHSDTFKTVISGIDYAYQNIGDRVFATLPIGYSLGENVELCFYDQDVMITGYTIDGDSVIWAV